MSDVGTSLFDSSEWPHGLRCMDCEDAFVDGQPIAKRLVSMTEYADEPAFVAEVICVGCSVASPDRVPGDGEGGRG